MATAMFSTYAVAAALFRLRGIRAAFWGYFMYRYHFIALVICLFAIHGCASAPSMPPDIRPDGGAHQVPSDAASHSMQEASKPAVVPQRSSASDSGETSLVHPFENIEPVHQSDNPEDPGQKVPLPEHPENLEFSELESISPLEGCIRSEDFECARNLARADLLDGVSDAWPQFLNVLDQDPLFTHTLDEEVRPHGTNAISALGGGSSLSFKYTDSSDERATAALKPDQDLRQTMYRSGIAFYRLCKVLGCHFDMPVTRPVKFSKSDFNALYAASTSKKNQAYRSKFEHLLWAKENGINYLYAAHKEWISPFDYFPIENTQYWHPYLKAGVSKYPSIDTLIRMIYENSRVSIKKNYKKLTGYVESLTTREFLQQISDLILMDYLTNNWDRFSGSMDNYGANCHIHPGGIIAIDNDASFPAWHAPRVVKRLQYVQVFSRNLVQVLRQIDSDELLIRLFPNPTKEERRSFERFKERRRDALKYIDGLIQKYGEDAILAFE